MTTACVCQEKGQCKRLVVFTGWLFFVVNLFLLLLSFFVLFFFAFCSFVGVDGPSTMAQRVQWNRTPNSVWGTHRVHTHTNWHLICKAENHQHSFLTEYLFFSLFSSFSGALHATVFHCVCVRVAFSFFISFIFILPNAILSLSLGDHFVVIFDCFSAIIRAHQTVIGTNRGERAREKSVFERIKWAFASKSSRYNGIEKMKYFLFGLNAFYMQCRARNTRKKTIAWDAIFRLWLAIELKFCGDRCRCRNSRKACTLFSKFLHFIFGDKMRIFHHALMSYKICKINHGVSRTF